jgi:hypothetical protein
MNQDEIKVNNCYSMMPINGRHTIVRVTRLLKITAYEEIRRGGIETLAMNPIVVRFVCDTPLTRQDGRRSGSNCCSMSLHWLQKRKLPAPNQHPAPGDPTRRASRLRNRGSNRSR